jgi:hypothetical protein
MANHPPQEHEVFAEMLQKVYGMAVNSSEELERRDRRRILRNLAGVCVVEYRE